MADSHKFISAVKKIAQPPESSIVDVVTGQIVSVSPLKVKVDGVTLSESFIIVGALCQEKKITLYETEILLWRGLQIGDKVLLLRVAHSQQYYMLQRKEGATP